MEIGCNKIASRARSAFTLMELILVMTIMLVIVAMVFPSLKGFFRGRNLDNEALRFLALTRYGQSRAVNEGVPVELWVNQRAGTYGLAAMSGYTETKTNALAYTLDSTVQISLSAPTKVLAHSNYWSQTMAQMGALTKIRFQPDGFISDASPENIYLRQVAQGQAAPNQAPLSQVWIAEAPTHLEYVIKPLQPYRR